MHEDAKENETNVPNSKARITFEKCEYMLGGYTLTLGDMDSENIQRPGRVYLKTAASISCRQLRAHGRKRNSFVLERGGGMELNGLWIGKVLLLIQMNVSRGSKSLRIFAYAVPGGDGPT